MGEQNRRAVEKIEPQPVETTRPKPRKPAATGVTDSAPERAVSPAADERQTARQAPAGASPGESSQDDSIG